MKRFEGKAIIVTGAASGIGEACVRRLYDEGALLVAVDQHKDRIDQVVAGVGDHQPYRQRVETARALRQRHSDHDDADDRCGGDER